MFTDFLRFEWQLFARKKSFLLLLAAYLLLGVFMGTGARFPFPDTYVNGTYVLTYIIGLTSLLAIFSTTLLGAQSLFREQDARFDAILFATPVRKMPYVLSRFSVICGLTMASYGVLLAGLWAGHALNAGSTDNIGPFRSLNYLTPFGLLLLPNIVLCTALACCIGLLTRQKLLVYIAGIFLYFLYWGISFYTNSPLIANSAPVSQATLHRAALLDPFGIAGFLAQTQHWTAWQRNNQLVSLTGNLLLNRLAVLGLSGLLLIIAYHRFRFTTDSQPRSRSRAADEQLPVTTNYRPVLPRPHGMTYNLHCLWQLWVTDIRAVVRSIPFLLLTPGWVGFLLIETLSDVDGNSRLPEKIATTGLMVNNILSAFPMMGLFALLIFGSEVYWRSHTTRFDALENSTPLSGSVRLAASWLSTSTIISILLLISIGTGIGIQLLKGNAPICPKLYASLFYLIGMPLMLNAGLVICLQALINQRYAAMAVSGVLLLVSHTTLGAVLGLRHPLLRFANTFRGQYSDMAGFGPNLTGFGYHLVFWAFITLLLFTLTRLFRGSSPRTITFRGMLLPVCLTMASLSIGVFIFLNTDHKSRSERLDWQQAYEQTYGFLKTYPQPTPVSVQTTIDLYPGEGRYTVRGAYQLQNKTGKPIDTLYLNSSQDIHLAGIRVTGGQQIRQDNAFGYTVFGLRKSLMPNDSVQVTFRLSYSDAGFNAPAAFNAIVANGSFIRISRYFPQLGYQSENEITDPAERKSRHLPPVSLKPLDAPPATDHAFIRYDALISTEAPQTVISPGELLSRRTTGNRTYFHYRSTTPIPFRFAVASARYAIRKINVGSTTIEACFHPEHSRNIDHLLRVAATSLAYNVTAFGPSPHKTVRFAEISDAAQGFAGTAYPGSLFCREHYGYQNLLTGAPERDILTELVTHELSHLWWGNERISPDERAGSPLLTETLAMYTELMLYKRLYGEAILPARVAVHKDLYLQNRHAMPEDPLVSLHPYKTYLSYDKGAVVMYQLYKQMGEVRLNKALRQFYAANAWPHRPPTARDLLAAFYAQATPADQAKIRELFTDIVTYDLLLTKATTRRRPDGTYAAALSGQVNKYREDGHGRSKPIAFREPVDVLLTGTGGQQQRFVLRPAAGKLSAVFPVRFTPKTAILDPDGKLLTRRDEKKSQHFINSH
nr:M1 family aminopeptidase [uncultured Arsenicibacter sp.]